jgi:hypothetical protein
MAICRAARPRSEIGSPVAPFTIWSTYPTSKPDRCSAKFQRTEQAAAHPQRAATASTPSATSACTSSPTHGGFSPPWACGINASSTTGSCPSAASRSATCEPMKPAPPVTRTRTPQRIRPVQQPPHRQPAHSAYGCFRCNTVESAVRSFAFARFITGTCRAPRQLRILTVRRGCEGSSWSPLPRVATYSSSPSGTGPGQCA